MKLRTILGLVLLLPLGLALVGCGDTATQVEIKDKLHDATQGLPLIGGDPDLDVHAVRSIREVVIHRIAVMPLVDSPDLIDKTLEPGAADGITADLYARATVIGGWEVVAQDDVDAAMQQLPPPTAANLDQDALALGRKVAADGVLYGSVNRYRERVGYDYAAQTPAAVAFTLNFVDERSGQIIWTAKFAKEQKSLSQNVFDLPNFLSNRARWVRAQDIASAGVQNAVESLHSKVTIQPVVQTN